MHKEEGAKSGEEIRRCSDELLVPLTLRVLVITFVRHTCEIYQEEAGQLPRLRKKAILKCSFKMMGVVALEETLALKEN